MKRVVVISDMHCGHRLGLTPPTAHRDVNGRIRKLQDALWDWYSDQAAGLGKVDLLVVNGDAIDGNAKRNGGVELFTTDRHLQADAAVACVEEFNATRVVVISGTPYHSGDCEEFERHLATRLGAEFAGRREVRVEGVVFNFRHHIGSSALHHGRATAVLRSQLNDILDKSVGRGGQIADVIVRSHAHYYVHVENGVGHAFVTPALQINSNYGVTRCEGLTDLGFLSFDVGGRDDWSYRHHRFKADLLRVEPMEVR